MALLTVTLRKSQGKFHLQVSLLLIEYSRKWHRPFNFASSKKTYVNANFRDAWSPVLAATVSWPGPSGFHEYVVHKTIDVVPTAHKYCRSLRRRSFEVPVFSDKKGVACVYNNNSNIGISWGPQTLLMPTNANYLLFMSKWVGASTYTFLRKKAWCSSQHSVCPI